MITHKKNITIEGRLFQISSRNIYITKPQGGKTGIRCMPYGVRRWQLLNAVGKNVRITGFVTYLNCEPVEIGVEKIEMSPVVLKKCPSCDLMSIVNDECTECGARIKG
jgi:hypothetical protein